MVKQKSTKIKKVNNKSKKTKKTKKSKKVTKYNKKGGNKIKKTKKKCSGGELLKIFDKYSSQDSSFGGLFHTEKEDTDGFKLCCASKTKHILH
jgi:hypothetical protein